MAILYKPFAVLRIVFCAIFLFIPVHAHAANSLFTVQDVEVDVTAASALEAKNKAFSEAQRAAYDIVLARMLSEAEIAQMSPPELSSIAALIKDFEVTEEKLSRVRYIGTYTFRFSDKAVRRYFSDMGLEFTDVRSNPILILPYYKQGDNTVLWGNGNEWLQAWNRNVSEVEGLVPAAVPIGDLEDVKDIGEDQALEYDPRSLSNMLKRYKAGEAVLAIAVPDQNFLTSGGTNQPVSGGLNIHIYRTDRATPEYVQEVVVLAEQGQMRAQVFDQAVVNVYKVLQRNWKTKTNTSSTVQNKFSVHVPIKNLQEWAETQKALKRVYGVDEIVLKSLSPKGAYLDLLFQGDEKRLRTALRQENISIGRPRVKPVSAQHSYTAVAPLEYDLYLNRYAPSGTQTY